MVIQTISQRYRVIRRFLGSPQTRAYLCREEKCFSARRFLLVGLTGSRLPREIIPYFMELNTQEDKGDFLDCFTRDNRLWLVFRYYEYPSLRRKLTDNLTLKERLELSLDLLRQILMQNLPYYLQYEVLSPDNVVVSDALEVRFRYLLKQPESFALIGLSQVQKRLADCLEMLFFPELRKKQVPELSDFLGELRTGEFADYFAIYHRYRVLYGLLNSMWENGAFEEKGLLLRIWERLKKLKGIFFKVLYAAALLFLAGLFVYLLVKPASAPENRILFQQIGTLDIRQEDAEEEGAKQGDG